MLFRSLAEKDALPGYGLSVETAKGGEPMLRMRRIDGKDGADRALPMARGEGDAGILRQAQDERTLLRKSPEPAQPELVEGSSRKSVSPGKRSEAEFSAAKHSTSESAKPETVDASALIRRAVAGLSDTATRGFMTDDTIETLRATCPGWDLHALHAEFEKWVNADAARLPANWRSEERRVGKECRL